MSSNEYILKFVCPDQLGIVRAVSDWLFQRQCNIIDSDQFGDPYTGNFFMRVHFGGEVDEQSLHNEFGEVAEPRQLDWEFWPMARRPRALIMVSKLDHCLADLLYRMRNNELGVDVSLIVSNHRDAYPMAAANDIDFLHLPVTPATKVEQESRLAAEISSRNIDFVVLARYMQILSDEFCAEFPGRIINIHHSFLPSFKGAKPYHQAHEKGVKLIGATAHYVTPELDEGPIIEQGIERVDHRSTPEQLVAIGRDIERVVLAKAVRYHAEQRILLNGHRTVVFD